MTGSSGRSPAPAADRRAGRATLWIVAGGIAIPIGIALALGLFSSPTPDGASHAGASTITVTVVDPKAPRPGQAFVYADPPDSFAPVVHVVAIDGARAQVAVRDLADGSRFRHFEIDSEALRASLLRAATVERPAPKARDDEAQDCSPMELGPCLRSIEFLRNHGRPDLSGRRSPTIEHRDARRPSTHAAVRPAPRPARLPKPGRERRHRADDRAAP